MSRPNPIKGSKPWPKGTSGNPAGRRPKLLSSILSDLKGKGYDRVGPANVIEAFELLMNLPEEEIKAIVADKAQPMIVRIVGKSMLSDKGWLVLQTMIDRAHGKAKQSMDLSGSLATTAPTVTVQVLPPSNGGAAG